VKGREREKPEEVEGGEERKRGEKGKKERIINFSILV
jgi:hypothetical protein